MRKSEQIAELKEEIDRLYEWVDHFDSLLVAYRNRLREHEHDTDGCTMWNGKRAEL